MTKRSSLVIFIFMLFIVAGSALARPVAIIPHTDITPDVVISTSTDNHLEGYAISPEGTMISFETRRGIPTPQELREADPSIPPYEIDVRFLDDTGFAFLTIYGGHGAIDPSWMNGAEVSTGMSDERTLNNYATARAIITAIKGSGFAKESNSVMDSTTSWAPERDILLNVAGPALEDLSVIRIVDVGTPEIERPLPNRARMKVNTNAVSSDIYKWQVEVHRKTASFSFGLGDHSATVSRSISSQGVTQQTIITSNHGTAANLMNTSCTWTSTATRPKSLPAIGSTTDGSYYYCRTAYGFTSGKHVCNDDTYIQAQTIRYKMGPASWVTCGDSSLRRYAPSCQ